MVVGCGVVWGDMGLWGYRWLGRAIEVCGVL